VKWEGKKERKELRAIEISADATSGGSEQNSLSVVEKEKEDCELLIDGRRRWESLSSSFMAVIRHAGVSGF